MIFVNFFSPGDGRSAGAPHKALQLLWIAVSLATKRTTGAYRGLILMYKKNQKHKSIYNKAEPIKTNLWECPTRPRQVYFKPLRNFV